MDISSEADGGDDPDIPDGSDGSHCAPEPSKRRGHKIAQGCCKNARDDTHSSRSPRRGANMGVPFDRAVSSSADDAIDTSAENERSGTSTLQELTPPSKRDFSVEEMQMPETLSCEKSYKGVGGIVTQKGGLGDGSLA